MMAHLQELDVRSGKAINGLLLHVYRSISGEYGLEAAELNEEHDGGLVRVDVAVTGARGGGGMENPHLNSIHIHAISGPGRTPWGPRPGRLLQQLYVGTLRRGHTRVDDGLHLQGTHERLRPPDVVQVRVCQEE